MRRWRSPSRSSPRRIKKDGEAFLAANKAKEGVVTLPSGLQYKILKTRDGNKPGLDDNVVCQSPGHAS